MPDTTPYKYEERLQERYIYMLCDPILDEEKSFRLFPPPCYIGESKDPFKRYKKHLYTGSKSYTKKNQWINELWALTGEHPRLKILESVISTFTPGDSLKIEKAWLWATTLLDYDLVNPGWEYFKPINFRDVSYKYYSAIEDRANMLLQMRKLPLARVKSHHFSIDSIKPFFGYTLITNDGTFLNFSTREDRDSHLKETNFSTKEWGVKKNQEQYQEHCDIVNKRAHKLHPLMLARRHAIPIFTKSNNWIELKKELWKWRWTIHKLPGGRGGIIFDGKYPTRLKKMASRFALPKLEERFGQEFSEYDPTKL